MAAMLFRAHDLDTADDLPTRLIAVEHERRQSLAGIVRGLGHQDEVLGALGPGNEPFMPGDPPFGVPHGLGPGQHHRRIGTGTRVRFGHHEGRANLAVDDRLQPLVLLFFRRDPVQHEHIAVIGRRAVEADRSEDRAVHLFVGGGHADLIETEAAPFLGHLRCPKPRRLHLVLGGFEDAWFDVFMRIVVGAIRLQRNDVLIDESAHLCAIFLDLGGKREVHFKVQG